MTKKIHMNQKRGLYGRGWTRCEQGKLYKRVYVWKDVTCFYCLRRKRK